MTSASPIRVLVVDDSVVVRTLVTQAIDQSGDLVVAGTASNGKLALATLDQQLPDAVVLDVEMPELDGLATLRAIRARWPRLPVIMFSTRTERGAATTIEALTCGASDYVTKPSNVGNVTTALERVRDELVPKLRALVAREPAMQPAQSKRALTAPRGPAAIVAVGASTGGPAALATVLGALPATFPAPIVVVQHMLATFTQHFAARLASLSALSVVEAAGGELALPGHIYLARGDFHLVVTQQGLVLDKGPVENFCRPAVDVLFRSVAKVYGARALGVVLTGMGADGLAGAESIQASGGNVIVQDEATSTVWGMPGLVARAGLANDVLPIGGIANELVRRAGTGLRRSAAGARS